MKSKLKHFVRKELHVNFDKFKISFEKFRIQNFKKLQLNVAHLQQHKCATGQQLALRQNNSVLISESIISLG
jgi:hypothetical protein